MLEVKNHILYQTDKPVTYKATPNYGKVFTPKYLILHYDGASNNTSAIDWMTSKISKVSAHLHIDREGAIVQLAPLNVVCWHAGVSSWKNLKSMNSYSIGIEMQNDGVQDYAQKQLEVVKAVTKCLVTHYNLLDVLGHSDISPGRKIDPGIHFPMAAIKDGLFAKCAEVTTSANVNLRSGAGTNFKVLATIKKGTVVKIIESGAAWDKVEVINAKLTGYISNQYLNK